MAYILKSKSPEQRRQEDLRAYSAEIDQKCRGIMAARNGRPGEKAEYPDLGSRYWALRKEQQEIPK